MTNLSHKTAVKNWNELAARGGIIRGQWQGKNKEGLRIACFLGALDPDIHSVKDCKADWLPDWLAELTPWIDDNVSEAVWPGMVRRYGRVLARMDRLTPEGSARARDRTMIAVLEIALPRDTNGVVAPVIKLLHRRIAGEDVTDEMASSAVASRAVAVAAVVAAEAAASKAAAWAAAWVASSAVARAAEAVAAADNIADACLTALEVELEWMRQQEG